MEIGIAAFRADLKNYVDQARDGKDVVITDRGLPVARLAAIDATTLLERLQAEGIVSLPRSTRRPPASEIRKVRSSESMSDLISTMRD